MKVLFRAWQLRATAALGPTGGIAAEGRATRPSTSDFALISDAISKVVGISGRAKNVHFHWIHFHSRNSSKFIMLSSFVHHAFIMLSSCYIMLYHAFIMLSSFMLHSFIILSSSFHHPFIIHSKHSNPTIARFLFGFWGIFCSLPCPPDFTVLILIFFLRKLFNFGYSSVLSVLD